MHEVPASLLYASPDGVDGAIHIAEGGAFCDLHLSVVQEIRSRGAIACLHYCLWNIHDVAAFGASVFHEHLLFACAQMLASQSKSLIKHDANVSTEC